MCEILSPRDWKDSLSSFRYLIISQFQAVLEKQWISSLASSEKLLGFYAENGSKASYESYFIKILFSGFRLCGIL